jgi:hypothetical protein
MIKLKHVSNYWMNAFGSCTDTFDTLDEDCFIRKPIENKELVYGK